MPKKKPKIKKMNTSSNQKIANGKLAGDTAVIKTFYTKNLPYVRRFITRHGGSMADVEDVFQDALVLIYHKLRNGSLEIHRKVGGRKTTINYR